MYRWAIVGLLCLTGCAANTPPPIPPMPDDLSSWARPVILPEPPRVVEEEAPSIRPPSENELLYPYVPMQEDAVRVSTRHPVDIIMEPGEQINDLIYVDREYQVCDNEGKQCVAAKHWTMVKSESDQETTPIQHVYISAAHPGQTNGLTIPTTRRVYHLMLHSVQYSKVRAVHWSYPPKPVVPKPKEPGILPNLRQPQQFHIGYTTQATEPPPPFLPQWIGDDWHKMYLVFSEGILAQVAPLVRGVDVNGPMLINSRQYRNIIIIDQLVPQVELRYGTGEHAAVVTITRGALRTIDCPGALDCPLWVGE